MHPDAWLGASVKTIKAIEKLIALDEHARTCTVEDCWVCQVRLEVLRALEADHVP